MYVSTPYNLQLYPNSLVEIVVEEEVARRVSLARGESTAEEDMVDVLGRSNNMGKKRCTVGGFHLRGHTQMSKTICSIRP